MKLIKTANQLLKCKSVFVVPWKRHSSVSWIISMQFITVIRLINNKQLYEYKKIRRPRKLARSKKV